MTEIVTPLSPPPSRQDPVNFRDRADTFFGELPRFAQELNAQNFENNAINTNVNAQSTLAQVAATNAAVSASAAAMQTTAPNWVSGTTYNAEAVVKSPLNGLPYRRISTGTGTIDPALDGTNWEVWFLNLTTGLPPIRPTLNLDFANSPIADPRLSNTTSNSTKTFTNALGQVVTAPPFALRSQHDPVTGECLGVLSEESYTNAFPNSENFSAWGLVNASVFGGTLTEATNGGTLRMPLASAPSVAGGETVVVWFDMSRANTDWVRLRVVDENNLSANFVDAWFNLATGQPGNLGASNGLLTAVKHGMRPRRGGVWRCWLTVQTTGSVAANVRLNTASANGATVNRADVGNGFGIGSAYTLHRAQMQLSSPEVDPLNYIPTTTTAVTVPADQIRMSGPSFNQWFNADRGTFLWVGRGRVPLSGSAVGFAVHSGPATPRIRFEFTALRSRLNYGGGSLLLGPAVSDNQLMAIAVTYRPGYIALASGGTFAEAFDFSLTTAPSILDIGGNTGGDANALNRPIAQMAYYPADVTTAQLIALSRT
jgi:hypothetical protein